MEKPSVFPKLSLAKGEEWLRVWYFFRFKGNLKKIMSVIKNPFEIDGEASRYDSFRPHYHHLPFGKIGEFFGKNFTHSLDLACGTGQSSAALKKISHQVTGCDISETMLRVARENHPFDFIHAPAEKLPFSDSTFDFVNISMAFHWFEAKEVLMEIKRVLSPKGYLNIDNYGFDGIISPIEGKQTAHHEFFSSHLPKADRGRGFPRLDAMDKVGLRKVKSFSYGHTIELSSDDFVSLIMTWSNFQIQKEADKKDLEAEMRKTYSDIFDQKTLPLTFKGKTSLYSFN